MQTLTPSELVDVVIKINTERQKLLLEIKDALRRNDAETLRSTAAKLVDENEREAEEADHVKKSH